MIYKSEKFSFHKIHIIQSLRDSDLKTGKHLYEDMKSWLMFSDSTIKLAFHSVKNKLELLSVFSVIENEIQKNGLIPLLHIDAHGSENGIVLSSPCDFYECINWRNLKKYFEKINILAKNNLVVILALCFGINILKIIQIFDRSPIYASIAPNIDVTNLEVEEGYQAFYQEAFRSLNVNNAMKALNSKLKDPRKHFHWLSTEDLFISACKNYIKKHNTAKARLQRAENIVTRFNASEFAGRKSTRTVRRFAKKELKEDPHKYFNGKKRGQVNNC